MPRSDIEAASAELYRATEWFDVHGATAVHGSDHEENCGPCDSILDLRAARKKYERAIASHPRASSAVASLGVETLLLAWAEMKIASKNGAIRGEGYAVKHALRDVRANPLYASPASPPSGANPPASRESCPSCGGSGTINNDPVDSYYGPVEQLPCPTCGACDRAAKWVSQCDYGEHFNDYERTHRYPSVPCVECRDPFHAERPPVDGLDRFVKAALAVSEWASKPIGSRGPVGSDLEHFQTLIDAQRAAYAAYKGGATDAAV